MTASRACAALIVVSLLSAVLLAQRSTSNALTDQLFARPMAITGSASSARYCVSGQAASVHGLGWVEAGTNYTITFDSDIPLVAAVTRLNLGEGRTTTGYGTPEIRLTASTSGNMALLVSGNGRAGCYTYKAQIEPPARSLTSVAGSARSTIVTRMVKPAKSPIQTMAISGLASSGKFCVGGDGVARVHSLGRVEAGARLTVTFDSDFDAEAGITNTDVAGQRGTFWVDDDGGGNLDPRLSVAPTHGGTMVLFVAGVGGAAGCYHYRVEATSLPAPSPTPSPTPALTFADFSGSWSGTFAGQSSGTLAFTVGSSGTITVSQPAQGDGTLTLSPVNADASFTTRAATGTCTWTGPFLPGGARQSSASGLWRCGNTSGTWSSTRATIPAPPVPAPATGRFDGTYDFSFVHPVQGSTTTISLPRFFIVRNGRITSSDNTVSGTVTDNGTVGAVQFTAPCWTSSGGTATWTGSLNAGSPKSGQGNYTCQNNIVGGTWRVTNGS